MWMRMEQAFMDALERAALAVVRTVPGLLVLVGVLVLFVLVAVAVRVGLTRLLRRADLDRRATRWGFAEMQESLPQGSVSALLGRLGYWSVVVAGFLVGVQVFEGTAAVAQQLLAYVPRVLLAVALLGVGMAAARFFEHASLVGAVNMQLRCARQLSLGVKWVVLVFAGALAFEHLGIGGALVTISFAILFGGLVLALALALGLGSRDAVRRSWEQRLEDGRKPAASGELRHL